MLNRNNLLPGKKPSFSRLEVGIRNSCMNLSAKQWEYKNKVKEVFLYTWMKLHFQSWDWNLGLTCWMRPHPHPERFHCTYWKKLLLSYANASTVQVSNHSSNQPLSVVKQTSPDMHMSRGLEKKKMHAHKTKVANTNTTKTKQNTKKNMYLRRSNCDSYPR